MPVALYAVLSLSEAHRNHAAWSVLAGLLVIVCILLLVGGGLIWVLLLRRRDSKAWTALWARHVFGAFYWDYKKRLSWWHLLRTLYVVSIVDFSFAPLRPFNNLSDGDYLLRLSWELCGMSRMHLSSSSASCILATQLHWSQSAHTLTVVKHTIGSYARYIIHCHYESICC